MAESYPALQYNGSMGGEFGKGIWTIDCNSWNEFLQIITKCNGCKYVWRGQRKYHEEGILPTIVRRHRAIDEKRITRQLSQFKKHIPNAKLLKKFFNSPSTRRTREFDGALSRYFGMICPKPEKNDSKGQHIESFIDDIYWAIGQHHGLQTPLLDWTKAPYKALFFAYCLEKENGDQDKRVVFGLAEKMRLLLRPKHGNKTRRYIEMLSNLDFIETVFSQTSIFRDIKNDIEPMFRRMNIQEGVFTRSLCNRAVEEHVRKYHERQTDIVFLIKIRMPDSLRKAALAELEKRNITYKLLFPDLHGATLHCNLKLGI